MRTFRIAGEERPLSRIALGTWSHGGRDWDGPLDDERSIATVHAALDLGINVIDTAPAYGPAHAEEVLGRALEGRRDEAFVATKIGVRWTDVAYYQDLSPASVREECEQSLRRLRTDRIDLLQIHWPHAETPLEHTLDTMLALQREGKVVHLGVSNFDISLLEQATAHAPVSFLQPPYHLFYRDVESELLPWCVDHGLATLVYGPLCKGLLTGKFLEAPIPDDIRRQDPFFGEGFLPTLLEITGELAELAQGQGLTLAELALAYTLARPGVSAAIVGARSPEQIAQTARAAEVDLDPGLAEAVAARIARSPPLHPPGSS
jgi:aryl-alcohol dehydrogenase-like predicted oxidoreductase